MDRISFDEHVIFSDEHSLNGERESLIDKEVVPPVELVHINKYNKFTYKVGKLIAAFFLCIITILALLLSKTSMIYIVQSVDVSNFPSLLQYVTEMHFIVFVPIGITAISDILHYWNRETKKKKLNPEAIKVKVNAIILIAFIEGIIESVGIAVFFMLVLPTSDLDVSMRIYLLNGVCLIPIIGPLFYKWNKWLREKPDKKKPNKTRNRILITLFRLILFCANIAGLVLICIQIKNYWQIPIALTFTSVGFWKNFVFLHRLEAHWVVAFKRHRYISSFVKSISKIIFIYSFSMFMLHYNYNISWSQITEVKDVWHVLWTSSGVHYTLLGAAVAYIFIWVACLSSLQRIGFALPVMFATPLSVIYQAWECKTSIFGHQFHHCKQFDFHSIDETMIVFLAGVLLWSSFILLTIYLWEGIDKNDANQQKEDLWAQPEPFCCLFLEQSMSLNRNRNPRYILKYDGQIGRGFHVHRTYITTTMYHESETEMEKFVGSLMQMDIEQSDEDRNNDYYEAYILFDNAFVENGRKYNEYVETLIKILRRHRIELDGEVYRSFGKTLSYTMKNKMKLYIHLKDVMKVRQKKRWSQILYVHLILEDVLNNDQKLNLLDANTYILMIDGDTQFSRKSVAMMRNLLELDRDRSGAVCGRIYPEGSSNPIVWYQKFEYAVGHWLQKTAEHVFGSVLCSPGCFSLVRAAALYSKACEYIDPNEKHAIEAYSKEVNSAMDVLKFDQGEDRMLSTLIIMNGWRLRYCAGAEAYTFCPEDFGGFFKQRRRWISSTLANLYFVLSSSGKIINRNASISLPFMIYVAGVFASSIFGPATVILVIIGGMAYAFKWTGTFVNVMGLLFPILYCLLCFYFNLDMLKDSERKKEKKINIQLAGAFILCAFYTVLMAAVAVGVSADIVHNPSGPDAIFLFSLIGIFILSALFHGELKVLVYGVIYLLFLPTMYLILIIFAIANTHDQSWGTRDDSATSKTNENDDLIDFSILGDCWFYFKSAIARSFNQRPPAPPAPPVDIDNNNNIVLAIIPNQIQDKPIDPKSEVDANDINMTNANDVKNEIKINVLPGKKIKDRGIKPSRLSAIEYNYRVYLTDLSKRLSEIIQVPKEKPKVSKDEQIEALAELQQMGCFLMLLCTAIWLTLVVVVGMHPELDVFKTNAVGLMFLIAFGVLTLLQFIAAIFHRLETLFNAIAKVPMSCDCRMTEIKTKKMVPKPKNSNATKYLRKFNMVDRKVSIFFE